MVKPRIIETNDGITGHLTVEIYDRFSQHMRDKGWNNVKAIINTGIVSGNALEIGPGPGYVGLEWLKQTADATLTACEISSDMIKLSEKNAKDYGYSNRTTYVQGNSMHMPFQDAAFDAVFSNGSLHEWEDPVKVFNEIHRVLKPEGLFCISDMRRDVNPLIKWSIYCSTKPKEIRPGFLTSYAASYTAAEIKGLLVQSSLRNASVKDEFFGLIISGKKA